MLQITIILGVVVLLLLFSSSSSSSSNIIIVFSVGSTYNLSTYFVSVNFVKHNAKYSHRHHVLIIINDINCRYFCDIFPYQISND
jgi:hypothetical protein